MTAPMPTGAAGFLARYEGLKGHLPGARKPWLNALRAEAAAHFAARGFPTRRVEQWKYTDLAPVAQAAFTEPLTMVEGALVLPAANAPHRAVFVDGRFAPISPRCRACPMRQAAWRRRWPKRNPCSAPCQAGG